MKRLVCTMGGPELGLLRSRLEEAGIDCELRDELISQAIHSAAFPAEIWILNDDDYPRAVALWEGWRIPPSAEQGTWTCPQCEERLDGAFATCWKCGTKRESAGAQ